MIAGFGIIGFRDPNGIRPVIYGRRKSETADGYDYMFASESVVLDALGFTDHVDVGPGEAVIITRETITKRTLVENVVFSPCLFEYVYFARQDSIIDGISVYKSRLAMGEALAEQVKTHFGDAINIDVIIPVSFKKQTLFHLTLILLTRSISALKRFLTLVVLQPSRFLKP